MKWNFDNSYSRLPAIFFRQLAPVPVREPRLAVFNKGLAAGLGLCKEAVEASVGDEDISIFSGNIVPRGACPIAQAYAGHQFGNFTMLGDGRAIVIGEHCTPEGRRFDVQLKGSGQTPFSRRGDGRAALGPMLREYLISEAMAALGIPTTRSLAVVETGETVMRETRLPGAILTRIAASHIRVGTFEFAAATGDLEIIKTLARYTMERHYPECLAAANPALAFLKAVIERQASLVARWMLAGFIHGVMNTDNMAISGETIDYGPCAFMNNWNPLTVFSSIDRDGRYAFGNQPVMAQWNLARFTEALLPLLHDDETEAFQLAHKAIDSFPPRYDFYWLQGMRAKLGLKHEMSEDLKLFEDLFALMKMHRLDFTNTFRALSHAVLHTYPTAELAAHDEFATWYLAWQVRLEREQAIDKSCSAKSAQTLMFAANPAYIPRNHRVEAALTAAVSRGDYSLFNELLEVLGKPFTEFPQYSKYAESPGPSDDSYQTFCGT